VVLISHNHPDHNSELKDIDDLCYEMWKRRQRNGEEGGQPYVLLWDEDSAHATQFGSESPKHQFSPIVMSSGFPQPFDLQTHPSKIPLKIIPFKVTHGSDVKHAMGMVIELLGDQGETMVRIGYTGDTEYFADLKSHLNDCDVVIAHISQPSIEELKDETKLKSLHLGYRGTAKLLRECQPKLTLLGEFWAGLTDLRIPLVKGIQERSGVKHILPSGLGMHLRLPSRDVECTKCNKPTPIAKLKVAPPTDSFGNLGYFCDDCMLNS
jgi:ribonuclease BN (tRNA processing enzyme)